MSLRKKLLLSVYANGKMKFIFSFLLFSYFLWHKLLSDFIFTFFSSSQALYSRIAISLWKSSKGLGRNLQMKSTSTPMMATGTGNTTFSKQPSKYEKRALNASESEASVQQKRR